MDFEELIEEYGPFVRSNILPIGLGVLGLILLSTGIIVSFSSKPQEEIVFQPAEKSQTLSKAKILVDVSGGVIKPGVYSLEEGARIKDVLILALGLSSEADRDWVSKNLNLAQKVFDGSKIYIPIVGETAVQGTTSTGVVSTSGLININSASISELDSLPEIGSSRAQKIIDNRPYSKIEDLTTKKVVTSKVFEKIKDKISVY